MATTPKRPLYLHLSCDVQLYAWGKVGLESEVALLKSSAEPGSFTVNEEQTYAELWMGTHIKGPSRVSRPKELSGQLLSDWLKSNQWALGKGVSRIFGSDHLPFLFKVLSINKSLSIQAHPSKEHAKALHHASPELYRDPNHKPELAIAISNFEGFCGFRSFIEIRRFVEEMAELREMLGEEVCSVMSSCVGNERNALQKAFTSLMECEAEFCKETLGRLVVRVQSGNSGLPEQEISLLLRLNSQFPGDIGCFCVFFLNFVHLQPGEALYLAPNEPHAYLYGEVVECMACSDNVVRAGLTAKYRDKVTLCHMLTYNMATPEKNKFLPQPHPEVACVEIYDPPTPEFSVARIVIPQGTKDVILPEVQGPSILLVVSGHLQIICGESQEEIWKGVTLFLPAASPPLRLLLRSSGQEALLFQAFCNA